MARHSFTTHPLTTGMQMHHGITALDGPSIRSVSHTCMLHATYTDHTTHTGMEEGTREGRRDTHQFHHTHKTETSIHHVCVCDVCNAGACV